MIKADWPRYVFASLADYFKDIAESYSLPVLVEHLGERDDALMRASDRAEIRITGPYERELSKDFYQLFVDVSILLVSRYGGKSKNPYDIMRYAGGFAEAMFAAIPVWNFGNQAGDYAEGELDTQIHLGCLSLQQGKSVQILHHGQVDAVEKIKMSEVNAKFIMELYDV